MPDPGRTVCSVRTVHRLGMWAALTRLVRASLSNAKSEAPPPPLPGSTILCISTRHHIEDAQALQRENTTGVCSTRFLVAFGDRALVPALAEEPRHGDAETGNAKAHGEGGVEHVLSCSNRSVDVCGPLCWAGPGRTSGCESILRYISADSTGRPMCAKKSASIWSSPSNSVNTRHHRLRARVHRGCDLCCGEEG